MQYERNFNHLACNHGSIVYRGRRDSGLEDGEMTLLDYKPGTAYIDICRSEFADSRRFDEFCVFMCAPKNSGALRIYIDAVQHGDIIMRNNESR